jgi:ABC-type polysaccharide/polyol phosphate transport system, ATPase component
VSSQSRIELQGISVEYSLLTVAEQNLKRKVMTGLGRRRKGEVETLAALDQVSLLLRPGTRLGVIGPNGAGKSTLLRVLAGALPPTRGRVHIDGKVFSLLGGAGAGLDYGLSGYENLIMSGLLLGESASAMKDRAAEIAEFSGLGDRLSNPIVHLLLRDARAASVLDPHLTAAADPDHEKLS